MSPRDAPRRSSTRARALVAIVFMSACGGSSPAPSAPTPPAAAPTRIINLTGDLAFGDVVVGQTATKTLMISNTGDSTLTVSGLAVPIGTAYKADWSSGTIAAGGSQTVAISFSPTVAESVTGKLTVTADHTSGTNTIDISGAGMAAPAPGPPPPSPAPAPPPPDPPAPGPPTRVIALSGNVTFGDASIGATAIATLTISNSGNALLTWTGIDTGSPAVTASPASGTVAAGGSQSVTLTFAPTAAQTYSGTVTVTGDQTSGTNTIAFSGTGTTAPPPSGATRIMGLSGDLAFGSVPVGTTVTRTLVIANSGNSPLTWSGITPGIPAVTASPTSGTVAPGGSQTVTLTFAPTAAHLQAYSSIVIVTGDQTGGSNVLNISATGVPAQPPPTRIVELSGDLAFGTVPYGSTSTRTFTIRNRGTEPLTVTGVQGKCCGFVHSVYTVNWTSGTIAPGGSQTVSMTFSPVMWTPSGWSGQFEVLGNQTGGVNTIDVSGAAHCSFSMTTPSSFEFGPAGGTFTVTVETHGGCWFRAGDRLGVTWPPWISFPTGRSATGSASLTFSVASLSTAGSRSYVVDIYGFEPGELTLGGRIFGRVTVTQTGPAAAGK